MIRFKLLHSRMTEDILGYIPEFLSLDDPRPAREQLDAAYRHGGGWRPFKGFRLNSDNSITYPGDLPLKPLAKAQLRNETIYYYQHSWVLILQEDRTFEVCRMD